MAGSTQIAAWSVKGVDRATRELARQASQAAGQTIGAWIEQAIRAQDILLPPGGPPAEVKPADDASAPPAPPLATPAAPAAPIDLRSLEHEVEQAESLAGDRVIPVALRVQQLAKRLIDIEQARVDGRLPVRPSLPEPSAEPPPEAPSEPSLGLPPELPAAAFRSFDAPPDLHEADSSKGHAPEDDAPTRDDETRDPPAYDARGRAAGRDDPPLTWDLDSGDLDPRPEPSAREPGERERNRDTDPLTLAYEEPAPALAPPAEEPPPVFELETPVLPASVQAERRPRTPRPARRPRSLRAAIAQALGAAVAVALGAATAVVLLNEGERLGLTPHLDVEIAQRIDQGLARGRVLWAEGEDLAASWVERAKAELDRLMAEAPPAAGTGPSAPDPAPAEPAPADPATADPAPAQSSAVPPPGRQPSAHDAAPPLPAPPPVAPPPATPATGSPDGTPATVSEPAAEAPSVASPETAPRLAAEATADAQLGDTKPAEMASIPPSDPPTAGAAPAAPSATEPQGPPREPEQLEKAGRQGDVTAQYELGVLAAQPESGAPDYGKAAYWFREAAVQGNASAQYNLGVLYEHGMGVGQDDVRALLWYHSAAEQGHSRAQYNLGVFYAQGRGIPTDYPEAQRWFKKAADQGIAKAFYNLAILAESGLGGPANPSAAKAYMSRAALLGDPQARAALTEPAKKGGARPEAATRGPSAELVGAIQHLLSEQGYEIGRIDGVLGDKTRQAIRKYQAENGLAQTGTPSDELLDLLSRRMERDTAAAKAS